jgi:hypothetical protein
MCLWAEFDSVNSLLRLQVNIALVLLSTLRRLQESRRVLRVPILPGLLADPDVVREREAGANAHERTVPSSANNIKIKFGTSWTLTHFGSSSSPSGRRSSRTAQTSVETPPERRPVP